MTAEKIAAAMERVASALRRKPHAGLHDDAPATVRWAGGLRTVARSAGGAEVATDMPAAIGGEDSAATPGWLLRTALASCAVTRIAMEAAARGIVLQTLEARATSRSDLRGLVGVPEPDGHPVPAGPLAVDLHVRIGAPGVDAATLRALVQATPGCSPVTSALEQPLAVGLHIDVAD
ncbi:OsmC family protein [Rubrivivax sp. RP6-9]|uniref:OsmC family protein n=1 Tax=Rubrivivax sp. RP6-9 TaxID=3415750 RepID=UPI003CC63256